jgi:hypothetical protein
MDWQAYLDGVRARYGLDDWPPADAATLIVHGFMPDLADTPYALARRDPRGDGGHHLAEHYVPAGEALSASSEVHLIVEIHEYADAAEAREALVERLASMMAPRLPDCGERGIEAGERCFCGVDDPPSALSFVRANVLVDISNAGAAVEPVAPLARAIDEQIMAAAGIATA